MLRLVTSFVFLCLLFNATSGSGQSSASSDVPPQNSMIPNTSQHGSQVESINTLSGALHVEIPFGKTTFRGQVFEQKYVYDSPNFHMDYVPSPHDGEAGTGGGREDLEGYWQVHSADPYYSNWRSSATPDTPYLVFDSVIDDSHPCAHNSVGQVSSDYYPVTNFALVDASGGMHPLDLHYSFTFIDGMAVAPVGSCDPDEFITSGWTLDGSGYFVDLATNTVRMKDGSLLRMGAPWPINGGPPSAHCCSAPSGPRKDSNGNMLLESVPFGGGPYPNANGSANVLGFDAMGNPQTISVTYTNVVIDTNDCPALHPYQIGGNGDCIETGAGTAIYPSKVTLPNGTYYQFTYVEHGHGELTDLRLPSGDTIHYDYGPMMIPNHKNIVGGTVYEHPSVIRKTITTGGVPSTWQYAFDGNMTITDPHGNCEVHANSSLHLLALGTPDFSAALERAMPVDVETYAGYFSGCDITSPPMKAVVTEYAFDVPSINSFSAITNIRPKRVSTTIDGLTSVVETDYDMTSIARRDGAVPFTFMNPSEVREYDFGATTPTRVTDYTYLHNVGNSTATAAQYRALNIVNRVATKTVKSGTDNAPIVSQTTYEYDNYTSPLAAAPNAALHDDTNFGSALLARGNVTAVSMWDNSTGNLLTTRYQYDILGNKVSSTDPKGNTTTFDYADSFNDQACVPSGQSLYTAPTTVQNAYLQQTKTVYSSCTAMVIGAKGPNDIAHSRSGTTYTYDSVNDLVRIDSPDSSHQTIDYQNYAVPYTMVSSIYPNGTSPISTTTLFDGLGRPSQVTNPDGATSETHYDLTGRVGWTTNPHTGIAQSTDGATSYAYDALNRQTLVCNPDNGTSPGSCGASGSSYRKHTYSGNTTTLRDEVGHTWAQTVDAFGRLTKAVEYADSGPLTTTYTYDTLGNLKCVDQWGASASSSVPCSSPRVRSFSYDSLSRLHSAANPETGTIIYSYYLDNGALCAGDVTLPCSKTDARGFKTSYSYDSMNRLVAKSYKNPQGLADTTPSSCYQYDTAAEGIGRLAYAWTQAGLCAATHPTNAKSLRSYLTYDPMGRLLTGQQCHLANCTASNSYSTRETYDLTGKRISYTNGVAGLTFSNSYDQAGRLATVSSSLADTTHPAMLFSSPTYTPAGALQNMTLGVGINVNFGYDNRLRPTSETAVRP